MGCGCGKATEAVTVARWQEAQVAERGYWYPRDRTARRARRAEEHQRAEWFASLLGITPEAVADKRVADIGGGPQPIVAWPELPLAERVLVDPMPMGHEDAALLAHVTRYQLPAEAWSPAGPFDEVWGYNVLQHVVNPVQVLTRVRSLAQTVRWFEWINQPISDVHPHTIPAELLREVFAYGWREVRWETGVRDEGRGWQQAYAAGVWERT